MSNQEVSGTKPPFLSDRSYDALKWFTQIFLPAAGALYFGLAQLWVLPKATEVVGTITVVDLFLGVLLGLSARQYAKSEAKFDGALNIQNVKASPGYEDKTVYSLELGPDVDVDNLEKRKQLTFKVNPPS